MASLGNILKREGGVPITGRAVTFHILAEDGSKQILEHQVEAILFPVGEEARLDAVAEARAYCEEQKQPHAFPVESDLRFLAKALRDPEDRRKQFVLADQMHLLRRGLVHESVVFLTKEYQELLKLQYPECFTQADFDKSKADAKGFTKGGPEEPGPSSP